MRALSWMAVLAAAIACTAPLALAEEPLPALAAGQRGVAVHAARVVTVDETDRVFEPGMVAAVDGRIVYVGAPAGVPEGYEQHRRDEAWAVPGMIDLHAHVLSGGFGDINDMVLSVGPELSTAAAIVPSNRGLRTACAAGVTTLFLIPGSGTSIGGFGVLYKTHTRSTFENAVFANPGGMKVAQTHNPERRGGDLGLTRAGLSWVLGNINDRARAATTAGAEDFALANLQKIHTGELPVLIHCAGSDGAAATVRMWRGTYQTRSVLSHGSLGGHRVAAYAARMGMPVNHGPRTQDYFVSRTGAVEPTAFHYWNSGLPNFSLNTDSPVIPQEELFLQGSMSARQGVPGSQALRALTAHPARAFGIDHRLGSLEVGKDADLVLWSGNPLDPRSRVELVLIDGELQYDRTVHGQWF
ncbi:MAG: amidohydrolase family protein [Planctomycetaceae bacterium]|nr:amidohydrolase family protein [Planctomycetaceae bacterium]